MNGAVVHVCYTIIRGLCRGLKTFRITRQGNIDILTSFVKVKVKEALSPASIFPPRFVHPSANVII